MLVPDGEARLQQFSDTAYPPTVTEVVPGKVYHVMGHGHSNAGFFIGDETVILVDTLDTDERGANLRELIAEHTDKPVRTIIFTHGHPDHRGGARAFADTIPEIIAFAPVRPMLPRTGQIAGILERRGTRQFGYELTQEEAISQGIGPREGFAVGEGQRHSLPPTTTYSDAEVRREIDGVDLLLVSAPGETEDQIFIWNDEHKVLFCADNYFGTWPNLYAIRGGQYRDVATWIDSLDRMLALQADAILPGHTRPIIGRVEAAEVLGNFRDALDYILTETLACIERGMRIDETVETVTLPERYRSLPYLQEHYGTVAWSVRSIYTGYVGWFDGNPTHLNPLPHKERAERTVALMGGKDKVQAAIDAAVANGDHQWAVELTDYLLAIDPSHAGFRRTKAQSLVTLGKLETSANGRHYYLAYAREILAGEV